MVFAVSLCASCAAQKLNERRKQQLDDYRTALEVLQLDDNANRVASELQHELEGLQSRLVAAQTELRRPIDEGYERLVGRYGGVGGTAGQGWNAAMATMRCSAMAMATHWQVVTAMTSCMAAMVATRLLAGLETTHCMAVFATMRWWAAKAKTPCLADGAMML